MAHLFRRQLSHSDDVRIRSLECGTGRSISFGGNDDAVLTLTAIASSERPQQRASSWMQIED
jgi:hypothetical protein